MGAHIGGSVRCSHCVGLGSVVILRYNRVAAVAYVLNNPVTHRFHADV